MTRLQRMFIQLSQYRTVDELEKATSEQFVDDLYSHLAFDENGKVHACGYFPNCKGCVIGCNKYNVAPKYLTTKYLNEEIDASHPQQNSIIIMRDNALSNLKGKFDKACKEKADPLVSALMLDMFCDMLEDIGLFEPHECHNELIRITKEKNK